MTTMYMDKNIVIRGFIEMNNRGEDQNKNTLQSGENSGENANKRHGEKIKDGIVAKIIDLIVMAIITIIAGYISVKVNMTSINNDIKHIKEDIGSVEKRLEKLDGSDGNSLVSRFNKLEGGLENNKESEHEKDPPKDDNEGIVKCNTVGTTLQTMIANVSSQEVQDGQAADCSEDAIIAMDSASHRKYTRKNLQKKKILVPYMEDGQEVYFLGQFNEKGHWDGKCTINVYIDNKLYLINDAEYNDGKLVKYNQVLDHDKTWIIAKRKPKGNYNVGDSVTYRKKDQKEKKFTLESVESGDILSTNDFKAELKEKDLEGFYHGQTRDGAYNDQSGNAYMVKYDTEGIVRTIYVGGFKGGVFNDNTGQAWEIAKAEGDFQYVYFKGKFKNEVAQTTKTNAKKSISVKKIHKIIDKIEFKCSVDLYGDE